MPLTFGTKLGNRFENTIQRTVKLCRSKSKSSKWLPVITSLCLKLIFWVNPRNDNFVCNRGEEKGTAEPSLFPPAIYRNTCPSERSEESHVASTNLMVDVIGINESE